MAHLVAVYNHHMARFLQGSEDEGVVEVATLICPEARQSARDLESDAPSRMQNSFGAGQVYEGRTGAKEKLTKEFAHDIAEWLDHARQQHTYTHIVLVAPPDMIGALRAAMNSECRKMVVEEVQKNLVEMEIVDMLTALPKSVKLAQQARL
ncbi:hypothetical protein GCM10027217_26850 [Pseudomaricurvus hydrocarbonicus]|nr:host attachment protein [Aestuariicella hydrocarbonica]